MDVKQERYTEAYSRIESSINTKHYFEAITIEESIISDRLASFLGATQTLAQDQIHRQSFANLIMLWKMATKNQGAIWENCDELVLKVDAWRKQRNKYVHGLVKFPYQKANIPNTIEFIKGAEKTAIDGKELANLVSVWRKRQAQVKRKYNKVQDQKTERDC
ncbi:MAG: hypothetical protein HOM14_06750 [Gammaproteobacteria bacterium]|jgi:hypothetical protein|nr:hypothetical protein [Gammaproteobacteria bacterium]MBT4193984.1 hypothetical protein [Gammaproteobacteria bacterium]MBT4448361.1 hypothetical protein [Gammaproteobacteria bacterium]MBT4862889.1 hypothetical protein [Gammaproteobacteria bacterium]MBT6455401.1 hypothetical protein [Gammaproteobacteria bacterium]